MRWTLTKSVHIKIWYYTNLSHFYHRLAARKTNQEAVMATTQKMLKVVYWMLREWSRTIWDQTRTTHGLEVVSPIDSEVRMRPRPNFCG